MRVGTAETEWCSPYEPSGGVILKNEVLNDPPEPIRVARLLHQREEVRRDADAAEPVVVERADPPFQPRGPVGIIPVFYKGRSREQ